MFDFLEGVVVEAGPTALTLRVGEAGRAVGYRLRTPLGTAHRLGQDPVRVWVLTVQQDDLPRLLGLAGRRERELCALLLGISGVGPKLALSLLSADGPERILQALADEDLAFLRAIKGLGPKTAQRLCLECRDKARTWLVELGGATAAPPDPADEGLEDAVLALTALGFPAAEAEAKVRRARGAAPEAGLEELVKRALRC
ncbi:MAG: Holliday junction branch migration protein RuvA [Planctomycetota bacterium]